MKHIKVNLWLRVENNSKFVRGRKRSIEEIERRILRSYDMRKESEDSWEYELTIPYEDDEELDNTIDGMIQEISRIADYHHCFIDYDVREKDSDRSW